MGQPKGCFTDNDEEIFMFLLETHFLGSEPTLGRCTDENF